MGQFSVLYDKRLIYEDDDTKIFYYKGKIEIVDKIRGKFILKTGIRYVNSLIERMMRSEIKLCQKYNDDFYISIRGGIYLLSCKNMRYGIKKIHTYRCGMNNPLYLVNLKEIGTFEDGIYYGEYWSNRSSEPVRIYRGVSDKWELVYEFPANTITHIHNIIPDRRKERLLILTGDTDAGSGIWEARNNFKSVRQIGAGKQEYRCCVAFPLNEGILYATDTPLEKNAIRFYDEKIKENRIICEIPGPAIYGREFINGAGENIFLFATSVEPDSRIRGVRYLLTRKKGAGVLSDCSTIWAGNPEKGFSQITALKKDVLPMGLFQFGNILFPQTKRLCAIPQAVFTFHGKTISLICD